MTPESENQPSTSKIEMGKIVEPVTPTPKTPLIQRCRPMTDEWILRAPSKDRAPRRSENYTSTLCPSTPRRRSDFQFRPRPLFAVDHRLKE